MRMCERRFVGQAHAMFALLVDMQIKRHMVFPQSLGEQQAVLHGNGFVLKRRPNKTGRRIGRYLQFVGKQLDQFRWWIGPEQIFL